MKIDKATVLAQFRAGSRKSELARQWGVSPSRIGQIIAQAEWDGIRLSGDPLAGLSERVRNVLKRDFLCTVAAVRDALAEPRPRKIPELGKVGLKEVRLWLDGMKT
jgi:hypothetical protein